ncbi:MAG: malto-oligosyltrehalose trehalohydrolase [Thermoguttaceae bacterium]
MPSEDITLRPQGAMRQADGGVACHVWAPNSKSVWLVAAGGDDQRATEMQPEGNGYFMCRLLDVEEGFRYVYRLDGDQTFPDPASRWQPEGVHRPSALFFPESYRWSDEAWRGVRRRDLVVYELHVGTFTPEGTLAAIIPRLSQLRRLGIRAIELMPVAQFPGDRGWGYDGVYPYAVQQSYGGPRALQELVNAAHREDLAVILDVVYNHFGPEGSYVAKFGPYFTDRHRTPWGHAINYDGPDSDPVRQFVIDNACYWVRDFHVDGLRLDAVQTIFDLRPRHIVAEIQAAVQRVAAEQQRTVLVIAETDQNDVRLVRPASRGGYGLDGIWADDFHHAIHAFLTGDRDGYYLDFGRPEQVEKALRDVFVYDGGYSPFRRRRHGARVGRIDRSRFVFCIQNHDQIGNRARGERLATVVSPAAERLACGLLMLSPCVPLIFMGEEYGERRPFPFFCSFGDPQLVEAVRRGRLEEFAALRFQWKIEAPDAQSPETFAAAKLDWSWPDGSPQAARRELCRDLLAARREWPALRDARTAARLLADHSVLLLERGGRQGVLAVANLSAESNALPKDAVVEKRVLLTTEDFRYGGGRGAGDSWDPMRPYELLVFGEGG